MNSLMTCSALKSQKTLCRGQGIWPRSQWRTGGLVCIVPVDVQALLRFHGLFKLGMVGVPPSSFGAPGRGEGGSRGKNCTLQDQRM
jgi:hypothetical protein